MDLNTNQAKQTFNQPAKKFLTLEARHSISIEAANKIRSKLSPRLFMPSAPTYRYTAKFQYCSKELKPSLLKNDNLRNQEFNSKFQTDIVQDLVKTLEGKFTRQSPHTMENNINLLRGNSRCKLRRKHRKRNLKHSLSVALQNLEKPMDIESIVTAREIAIRNWGQVQLVGDLKISEGTTRYITDYQSDSMNDPLALNSSKPLYKDKNTNDAKNLHTNVVQSTGTPAANNSPERVKNDKSKKNARKQIFNSKIPPTKIVKTSKESTNQEPKEASCTKIEYEVRSKAKKHSEKDVLFNSSATFTCSIANTSADLQNVTNTEASEGKVIENIGKVKNMPNIEENVTQLTEEKLRDKTKQGARAAPQANIRANKTKEQQEHNQKLIIKETTKQLAAATTKLSESKINLCSTGNSKSANSTVKHPLTSHLNTVTTANGANGNREHQTITNAEKSRGSINENNKKLIVKETTKQPAAATTKSSESKNNLCSTGNSKSANYTVKHPLTSHLNTATTAIADFQDTVRSSVSLIYDCSPMDNSINEELMKLENSLETFSKFLLQTYNDVNEKELKTNNCIEYLRKKEQNCRWWVQSSRSQTALLNQSNIEEPTSETLTIFIEADKMPKQCITFKAADILGQKAINDNNKTNKIAQISLNTSAENVKNLRNKTSNERMYYHSSQVHTKLNEVHTEPQNVKGISKSNNNFARLRKKVTPKKAKPLVSNTQNQTTSLGASLASGSYNAYEQNCLNSVITTTSAYTNPIYTQAQNYDKSYLGPYSLGLHSIGYNSSSLITSPVLTNCPVEVTNCYNYPHAAIEDLNTERILLAESRTGHLYPPTQNFNAGEPHQIINENTNRFEYHSSLRREPYLKNHYVHHDNEDNAYNFQTQNNFGILDTTNLPAFEDSHTNYG